MGIQDVDLSHLGAEELCVSFQGFDLLFRQQLFATLLPAAQTLFQGPKKQVISSCAFGIFGSHSHNLCTNIEKTCRYRLYPSAAAHAAVPAQRASVRALTACICCFAVYQGAVESTQPRAHQQESLCRQFWSSPPLGSASRQCFSAQGLPRIGVQIHAAPFELLQAFSSCK